MAKLFIISGGHYTLFGLGYLCLDDQLPDSWAILSILSIVALSVRLVPDGIKTNRHFSAREYSLWSQAIGRYCPIVPSVHFGISGPPS